MNVSREFSRYADHYGEYNIIQNRVADRLIAAIGDVPKVMLDIGCGNGAIARRIDWDFERLVAVDFAPGMLELHPKSERIECLHANFDDPELYNLLRRYRFERIFSASALQWSPNLERTLELIRSLEAPVSFAIFTAGTFETLFKTAGLSPILKSAEHLEALCKRYLGAVKCEKVRYELAFESVREMFRYIKRSGVSGNRNVLSYWETRELMQQYPLEYLEFEVLFIQS